MMHSLGSAWVSAWLRLAAAQISAESAYLSALDRAIGDGDHGTNMARGMTAVAAQLDDTAPVARILRSAATVLLATVGGAAGPLYGTAFLRAAHAAPDHLTSADLIELFDCALEGIVERGQAAPGEKTMVDAWVPAVAAARAHAGAPLGQLLRAAAAGAAAGAVATEPMQATKGRAAFLGERSIGHRDPGAQSSALLFRAAAAAAADVAGVAGEPA